MGGEKGGSARPNPGRAARRPLTRQPERLTRESPPSWPLVVLAVCLPKNAPCIPISPARKARLRATWAFRRSPFCACSLPAQGQKEDPLPRRRRGRGGTHQAEPRSPFPAEPSSWTLPSRDECHLDRGPRVRSPLLGSGCLPGVPVRPWRCRRACAPPLRLGERSAVPSAASPCLPPAGRIAAKPGSSRAKKWEGERLSALRGWLADSASPGQTLAIPTATFPLPLAFPQAAARSREAWSGQEGAHGCGWQRAAEWVGGWVGGERGGERTGGEGRGRLALLPLPAWVGGGGGGGLEWRVGRGQREGRGRALRKTLRGPGRFRGALSVWTFLQARGEPFPFRRPPQLCCISLLLLPRAPGVCV